MLKAILCLDLTGHFVTLNFIKIENASNYRLSRNKSYRNLAEIEDTFLCVIVIMNFSIKIIIMPKNEVANGNSSMEMRNADWHDCHLF